MYRRARLSLVNLGTSIEHTSLVSVQIVQRFVAGFRSSFLFHVAPLRCQQGGRRYVKMVGFSIGMSELVRVSGSDQQGSRPGLLPTTKAIFSTWFLVLVRSNGTDQHTTLPHQPSANHCHQVGRYVCQEAPGTHIITSWKQEKPRGSVLHVRVAQKEARYAGSIL